MSRFFRLILVVLVAVGLCLPISAPAQTTPKSRTTTGTGAKTSKKTGKTAPGRATPKKKNSKKSTTAKATKKATSKKKTSKASTKKSATKTKTSTRKTPATPPAPPPPPTTPWTAAADAPVDAGIVAESDFAIIFKSEPAQKAVKLINDGNFLQARDVLLQNADTVAADHRTESRFLLAWACHNGGDWLCVQSITDGLASEIPVVADHVILMRATALAQTGLSDQALELLALIPAGSTVFFDSIAIKARALIDTGRDAEAAQLLAGYLDDGAVDADIIGEIAEALLSSGKRDQAISELRKAYREGSRSGLRGLLSRLGITTETGERGELEQAWAYLNAHDNKRALKAVGPRLAGGNLATRCEATEIAARANTKLREHPEAFRHFKTLVADCAQFRDMPAILFLGIRSAYRSGDGKTGDLWTVKLATEYPDASFNDDIAVIRARMAIDDKRHDDAMKILEESVRRWPDGDMANESRWLLAWSSITDKKYQQAARRLEEAERMAAGNARYASMFAYWNGRVLQKAGKQSDAKSAWEHCALSWPMTFYAILSLNRLAEAGDTTPDKVLADLVAATGDRRALTGQPFLRLGDGKLPESGPAARALWFYRVGLPGPAMREVRAAPADDNAAAWLKSLFLNMRGDFTPSHRMAKDRLALTPFWPDESSAGYYRLAYPRPFGAEVGAAAAESSVDPLLIWAVMREESAFVSGVESWANATGLMQLIMPTAESMAKARGITITKTSLTDPGVNVRLGATYLRKLLDRFDNPILAIPGYNAGGGAIARWLDASGTTQIDEFVESIPASEAREYARKVFESWAAYSYLYGAEPFHVTRVDFRTGSK